MTDPLRVVFLHGFAGVPEDWDAVRAALGGVDSLALALLGHGATDTTGSFEAEVDRVASRLASGGPAHLVGYSLGGRVALGVLARHPALVSHATVVSASAGLSSDDERRARVAADERWARLLEHDGVVPFLDAWDAQPLFASRAKAGTERLAARRALRLAHDPRALARAMRVLGLGRMPCWLDALEAASVPVTFVAGGDDARFVAAAERMARRTPRAQLRIVERTGHDVPFERPDVVAAIIATGESR